MNINWTPPKPRAGLTGQWDTFIGPGATPAENWIIIGGGMLLAGLVLGYAYLQQPGWTTFQWIGIALLALDLTGGVISNASSVTKRWYHREGQGFGQHMGFIAVHFVHPLVMGVWFLDGDWLFFGVVYGFLLAASVVILRTPLYVQRPVAVGLFSAGLVMNLFFAGPPALAWFLPVFYLKLLVCHLPVEAPFGK